MSKCYLYGSGGGGAAASEIAVTAPAGSTVTCSQGGTVKTAAEQDGLWRFRGCGVGTWTVTAVLGEESASETVEITQEDQRMCYRVEVSFRMMPGDFDLAAYGTKGVNYQVLRSDGTEILPANYGLYADWRLLLLTEGSLKARKGGKIDVFCAGGGGGGGNATAYYGGGGGGGGKTASGKNIAIAAAAYPITIGAGGAKTASGGSTSAFGILAEGGSPGSTATSSQGGAGGAGGSGGGGGGYSNAVPGSDGGSDGTDGNGKETVSSHTNAPGGTGQGTTTREFGESTGTLYCGGGGGGLGKKSDGSSGRKGSGGSGGGAAGGAAASANTGGGGGGGNSASGAGGAGGSGIVVIRSARG